MSFFKKSLVTTISFRRFFLALLGAVILGLSLVYPVAAAGESYELYGTSLASGSKIIAKGGIILNSPQTLTLQKSSTVGAYPNEQYYAGTIEVNAPRSSRCKLAIAIKPAPAPPLQGSSQIKTIYTGNPSSVSNPGADTPTPYCTDTFASSLGDFNRSGIAITKKSGSGPTTETAGQREITVVVSSEKKLEGNYKDTQVSVKRGGSDSIESKKLTWNSAGSSGVIAFSNKDAGSYLICVKPSLAPAIPSTASCQSKTKIKGEQLTVNFGNIENAYNEDGAQVDVTIKTPITEFVGIKDIPSIKVVIYDKDREEKASGSTEATTLGDDTGYTPAQTWSRVVNIDDVPPGKEYLACVAGLPDKCVSFTKEKNKKAAVTINLTAEEFNSIQAPADTNNCRVEGGLGWLLCPVLNTIATLNDGAFTIIQAFLESPPLVNEENVDLNDNGIYRVWSMVRNVANVFFVIIFLVIVYSQITSIGVSNYGVKKMLPKLIVGAVLINTSFWTAGVAVDISNVVGRSIYEVLQVTAQETTNVESLPGSEANNWVGVTALVLGGGVALVAAGLAGLFPMALAGLFAFIGLVFTLTFRHAMVFILIAIAPLAIASYLLPNTDGFFKAWWKLLKVLLYIYPVVAFVMGVSTIAAAVTFDAANEADGLTKYVMQLIAAAMPAMGVVGALLLAKTMGSILGKLGITNPLSGFTNAAKDRAKSFGTRADKNIGASSMRGGKFRRKVLGGTLGRIGGHRGKALRSIREKTVDDKFQGAALNTDEGRDVLMRSDVAKSRLATTQAEAKAEFEKRKAANDPMDSLGAEAATNAEREYIAQVSANNSSQITKESIADNLRDNPDLQAQAAGADPEFGATRARASAKHTLEQLAEERVKTEKSDMSKHNGDKLMLEVQNVNNSTERKAAALELIGSAGEDRHVKQAMDYIGSLTGPDAQDLQQQFYKGNASRINAIASQQDKNALALGAFGAAAGPGAPPRTYEDVLFKRVNDGSMSGERMASLTKTQLQDMYEVIATRGTTMDPAVLTKLETSIEKFRTNKTINQPESKITDEMDKIKTLL